MGYPTLPFKDEADAAVDGKVYKVYDYETFNQYRDELENTPNVAVRFKKDDGSVEVLPVRGSIGGSMTKPGVYTGKQVDIFSSPSTEEEKKEYYPKPGDRYFDFGDVKTIQEYLDKSDQLYEIKNQILESPDNLTIAPLKPNDEPAMRGLKLAVNAKGIDLDKYKDRFGVNYPNNKRKLTDTSITLFQMERFCECLDMDMDITLRDKEGSIANPMRKKITVNVYPGNGDYVHIENVDDEISTDSDDDFMNKSENDEEE